MTSRRRLPLSTVARPISAIYIGPGSVHDLTQLPSLPEPPSPLISPDLSSDTRVHQLPSPPATNSNSSGSIGDAAGSSTGSRTIGRNQKDMLPDLTTTAKDVPTSDTLQHSDNDKSDDDDDDDDDGHSKNDDHTAKFSGDLRRSTTTQQSTPALARVRSLTERNRQLAERLNSLTIHSRHNTPSPHPISRRSATEASPAPLSPPILLSTKSTTHANRNSFSGSETEREPSSSQSSSYRIGVTPANTRSLTPPLSVTPPKNQSPRQRLVSAPSSPGKLPARPRSSVRGRRVSIELGDKETARSALTRVASKSLLIDSADQNRDDASVRSRTFSLDDAQFDDRSRTASRQGEVTSKRPRQPLPREFRDVRSADGASIAESSSTSSRRVAQTAGRNSPSFLVARGSPSPSSAGATLSPEAQTSPKPPRASMRNANHRESLTYHSRLDAGEQGSLYDSGNVDHYQSVYRTGSTESPSLGGRSVARESLRAAGLARRRDEDVFTHPSGGLPQRRTRLSGGLGNRPQLPNVEEAELSDTNDTRLDKRSVSRATGDFSESHYPNGTKSSSNHHMLGSRPPTVLDTREGRSPHSLAPLRTRRSTYALPEQHTPVLQASRRGESVYTPPTPSHSRLSGRHSSLTGVALSAPASEHAKLMLDSLSMFESHLARLPTAGGAALSASTIPDLYRNAQSVVHSAGNLNTLLREANARALEQQIEAEIQDDPNSGNLSELWRTVGSEYRESMRVSDELVRTMTGFLLGMGRVLRELTAAKDSTHAFDDDGRASPNESAGRRSMDSRRSLELRPSDGSPRERERYRDESLRRIATQRAPSVLSGSREPSLDDSEPAPVDERATKTTMPGLSSVRRIFTAKASRQFHKDTPDTPHSAGLPRVAQPSSTDRVKNRRSLPLGSVPPLPSLPSETLLARSASGKSARHTLKPSNASISTVRGAFPSISTSQPTTAITPTTVTNASEKTPFPLFRSDSTSGTIGQSRGAESAVGGFHDDFERYRTASNSSNLDNERMAAVIAAVEPQPAARRTRDNSRMSFDNGIGDVNTNTLQNRHSTDKRDRRRTVTEIFSRDSRG